MLLFLTPTYPTAVLPGLRIIALFNCDFKKAVRIKSTIQIKFHLKILR